jgi:hypothetical protein
MSLATSTPTKSENGFGRAVSRILSSLLRAERIICLSDRYPKPVSLSRNAERAAPRFPIWPCTRWGFPCRPAHAGRGALLPHLFTLAASNGLRRSDFLWHFPSKSLPTFRPRVSPAKPELRGITPDGVRTFLFRLAPKAILRPSKTKIRIAGQAKNLKCAVSHFTASIAFQQIPISQLRLLSKLHETV